MKRNFINMNKIGMTLVGAITLLYATNLFSQAVATIEDSELLMGNTTGLKIEVPMPSDSATVVFPLLQKLQKKTDYATLLNDTVEVRLRDKSAPQERGGQYWMKYELTLQAFDSGRYELPPFEFLVNGEEVTSNPLELSVIPVKVKADDKIDDFSDVVAPFDVNPNPEELEETDRSILGWVIAAAVVFLALIVYMWIRYRKTGSLLPVSRPLPPYQIAINKLNKLHKQSLPAKGKTKEYYTRLTDILRKYLKNQFGVKTLEKTSAEILTEIKNDERISQYEGVLKSIFETADFVKFAKVNPSVVENGRCMTDALRFVEASKPEEVKTDKKGGAK